MEMGKRLVDCRERGYEANGEVIKSQKGIIEALDLNISQTKLSRYETGKDAIPPSLLKKWHDAFNASYDELFGETEAQKKKESDEHFAEV